VRPKEHRQTGQGDIFQSRLDQIIDPTRPLVKLAKKINCTFLEVKLGAVYTDKKGRPHLPTRLMAGRAILKATHDLSDEVLCACWIENPYLSIFLRLRVLPPSSAV